jgi:hypothetical protein
MSPVLLAGSLFEHLRHICDRPRMYAPAFDLGHLFLFVMAYEAALGDANLPSQHERFKHWIYARHPEWQQSPLWWAEQVQKEQGGDLQRTLGAIARLIEEFLAGEGKEFVRFPERLRES